MTGLQAALCASALLFGCAGVPAPLPHAPAPEAEVRLEFASDVPDAYYLTAGPADSYERFAVNARLRAALEAYARRGSGKGPSEPVALTVRLLEVRARYRDIGPGAGDDGLFGRESSHPHAPAELTKTVELTLAVAVSTQGREPRWETLSATGAVTIRADDFDRDSYRFEDALEAALSEAVARVDLAVTAAALRVGTH